MLLGHLTITVPAIAITASVIYFQRYLFGPLLTPYFVLNGLALSWQWYVMALAKWKASLERRNVRNHEFENLARQSGLYWRRATGIGLFAMHTSCAEICAVNVGPWLVFHWFGWVLPLAGFSTTTLATNYYLQHLEVVSIVPALVVGYLMAKHYGWLATWAWIFPTIVLSYKLWTFADPRASIFAPNVWSRFSYYFVIVQVMPTFQNFNNSDPVRVAEQMFVVAPFYAAIAYTCGALLAKWQVLERFSGKPLPDAIEESERKQSAGGEQGSGRESSAEAELPPSLTC